MEHEETRMRKIKIGGREFELAYTLRAMRRMHEEIEGFDMNDLATFAGMPETLVKMLYILAENGAKLKGENLDADEEWFEVHIPVNARKFMEIQIAVNEAIADGMMMETEMDEERGKVIDVVLRDIQKKREKTGSAGEK